MTVTRTDCPTATVSADSTGGATAGRMIRRTVHARLRAKTRAMSSRSASTPATASRTAVVSRGSVTRATTRTTTPAVGPSQIMPTTTMTIGGTDMSTCTHESSSSRSHGHVPIAQPSGSPIRQEMPSPTAPRSTVSRSAAPSSSSRMSPSSAVQVVRGPGSTYSG